MLARQIGDIGEDYTAKYLKKQGCKILARNFSCKMGEIDIIAQKGELIHFVEVKTRQPNPLSSGESAINASKISKIVKTARYYILTNNVQKSAVFDASIVEVENGKVTNFEYIQRAFDA